MGSETTTDWITAIGSGFAAIGTVGAVAIALWQTRRRDAYKVHVRCSVGITGDEAIGDIIALEATNMGRPIKLTMAYLLTNEDRQVVAKFFNPGAGPSIMESIESSPFGKMLIDGDGITVHWRVATLDIIRQREGFEHYQSAFFTDPLGNRYMAPYPGVTGKRARRFWQKRH